MSYVPIPEELELRATARRAESECGVGAALGREITEPGRDGRLWECVITDTIDGFRWVEAEAPRAEHHVSYEVAEIERQVELAACRFVHGHGRLDAIAASSPIRVELYLKPPE